jgi:hypothetical protein
VGLLLGRQLVKVGEIMDDPGTSADRTAAAGDELSFRADAVMPAQFYTARRSASFEPIVRLMGGILIDAVRCFQRNFDARQPYKRQEFREARFWIFHDRGKGPFSFEDVCNALEIDPRRLRDLIVRWEKSKRSGDDQRITPRSLLNIAGRMPSHRETPSRSSDSGWAQKKSSRRP